MPGIGNWNALCTLSDFTKDIFFNSVKLKGRCAFSLQLLKNLMPWTACYQICHQPLNHKEINGWVYLLLFSPWHWGEVERCLGDVVRAACQKIRPAEGAPPRRARKVICPRQMTRDIPVSALQGCSKRCYVELGENVEFCLPRRQENAIYPPCLGPTFQSIPVCAHCPRRHLDYLEPRILLAETRGESPKER